MNYKQIKNVAEARKIMIKDIAEELGFTPNGFKVSIETEKFPIGKLRDLCEILSITISEFFGEEEEGSTSWMVSEGEGYSQARQSPGEVAFLRRQIEVKDKENERLWRLLMGETSKKTKSA